MPTAHRFTYTEASLLNSLSNVHFYRAAFIIGKLVTVSAKNCSDDLVVKISRLLSIQEARRRVKQETSSPPAFKIKSISFYPEESNSDEYPPPKIFTSLLKYMSSHVWQEIQFSLISSVLTLCLLRSLRRGTEIEFFYSALPPTTMMDENLLLHTLVMCPYLGLFLPVSFPLTIFELYIQFQPNKTKGSQRKLLGNRQATKGERPH